MSRAEQHAKLSAIVPRYMDEEFIILAAWYCKNNVLTLDQAVDIAEAPESEIEAVMAGKKSRPAWIEIAREFAEVRNNKKYEGHKSFRAYVLATSPIHYYFVLRLLATYDAFVDTPVQSLTHQKAEFLLRRLPPKLLSEIQQCGTLTIKGKTYTIEDLKSIPIKIFYRLISKKNQSGTRPALASQRIKSIS